MATFLPSQLFDHLVGKREQRRRHREAKQPGCGRKCPVQEGVEKARREFDQADDIGRRHEAYMRASASRLLAAK